MTLIIVLVILFILGNAFFVAAEFGLVSARRSSIELRALNGSRAAKITLSAMEQVSVMLAGAQLGITVCSLALGALGEPLIAHALEGPFASFDMPSSLLHPLSFAIALAIMTYLHVVFGEMVPKNIALALPERIALIFVPPLVIFVRLCRPVVVSLNHIANACLRMISIRPKGEVASSFTRDEVAGFVEESHREGLLSEDEEHLLSGSLEFDERDVRSVLLPPEKLQTITSTTTPKQVEELVTTSGFSRFPLQNDEGTFTGYVHLKDVLDVPTSERDIPLSTRYIRRLISLKATDSLRDALTVMQEAGTHVAEVIDAQGRQLGVVMLEDVIEELVGTIRDDSQRNQPAAEL